MKDILIAARAKIADPAHWTQHVLARDINGNNKPDSHPFTNQIHWEGLTGDDPMACSWCAIGSLEAVAGVGTPAFRAARRALDKAAYEIFGDDDIAIVNDNLDHAAVLQCYAKAIEQL